MKEDDSYAGGMILFFLMALGGVVASGYCAQQGMFWLAGAILFSSLALFTILVLAMYETSPGKK